MVQTNLKTNAQDLCSLEKKKMIFSDVITDLTRKAPHMEFYFIFISSQGKFSIGGKRRHLNRCLNL
jgi:hypothetical protein